MATMQDLIAQVQDAALRDRLLEEANKLLKHKKFGLVFEEHLPECTPLYDIPVRVGGFVAPKAGYMKDIYRVLRIADNNVVCRMEQTDEEKTFPLDDVVTIAQFGDPIYPCLKKIDAVENAPESDLWHTLIEADNYHALQLLEYLYAEKVDCIYIDPPYNTGAKDWKYNNDYVDSSDAYRHSKWLSMMEKRLKLAKKLLNPQDSVLIVTIDEKEFLHLGCLLEEMFPEASIQMVSTSINGKGVARDGEFARVNEYAYVIRIGSCSVEPLNLFNEWMGNVKKTTTDKVRWGSLMRSGTGAGREDSPGCFYPIYISGDKKRLISAGEPLPIGTDRNTVPVPEGQIVLWPIHADGKEGRWQYGKDNFERIQQQGYVRISTQTNRGEATLRYISEGWQKKVENGQIKVVGKADDGSLIFDDDDYEKKYIPGNQWWITSHDATEFGTKILNKIIGKRFSFPKSFYAVHDILRFFVANKPNALILDFFAGSGTTLHAVNLLNVEDGGKRRCILVTNNEVSAEEAKTLTTDGHKPGDEAWERLGIARYVTWPRTVCSIEGHDVNGVPLNGDYGVQTEKYVKCTDNDMDEEDGRRGRTVFYKKVKEDMYPELVGRKMADGFPANAIFFKLGFLDKTAVALGTQFKALLSTLWMKAGAVGACPELSDEELPDMLILPKNQFAVLLEEMTFPLFQKRMKDAEGIRTIFFVTDSEPNFRKMSKAFPKATTYQLYRDYLSNFRINTGRQSC